MRSTLLILTAMMMLSTVAGSVPLLQVYLEGATYDGDTDTWVVGDLSQPIRLWTIGNVDGPGGMGDLYDVRLSIAYDDPEGGAQPSFTLTPSTTGGYMGVTDPSTPGAPTLSGPPVTDGSSPTMADGGSLPPHGIFGAGTHWQEYQLGDFTLTDSPIADFMTTFPAPGDFTADAGQINVYEIGFTGDANWLHFDLYGYYLKQNGGIQAVNAPFSHDGEAYVPEPVTGAALLSLAFAPALAAFRKKRKK